MDIILTANTISAIGALLLFCGYYQISIKKNEKKGILLSGIGSFIMCFAFYLLDSLSFLILNIIWTIISVIGYANKDREGRYRAAENSKLIIFSIFILLVIPGFGFMITNKAEIVSWLSIMIMLASYFSFSLNKIENRYYIIFTLLANIICLTHLLDIKNYSSIIQTLISIGISIFSLSSKAKSTINKIEPNIS